MLLKVGTVRRVARAFCFSSRTVVFALTLWISYITNVFLLVREPFCQGDSNCALRIAEQIACLLNSLLKIPTG